MSHLELLDCLHGFAWALLEAHFHLPASPTHSSLLVGAAMANVDLVQHPAVNCCYELVHAPPRPRQGKDYYWHDQVAYGESASLGD